MKISILIPVFNESDSLPGVLTGLLQMSVPFPYEIIVINDGSTDSTLEKINDFLTDSRIIVLNYSRNRGYGSAIKEGIRRATGEYIVTYDGDGQFNANDIVELVSMAKSRSLHAVFGERRTLANGGQLWRAPGKFLLRMMIRLIIGIKIKDFNCGLRVIHTDTIRRYMHVCSNGFSFSMTSLLILIERGYEYSFKPISLNKRQGGRSTVHIRTGLNTIYLIIKLIMLFKPLKIFAPIGILSILVGLVVGGFYFLQGNGLSVGSLLFFAAGFLCLFLGLIADQIAELRKSQFEINYHV